MNPIGCPGFGWNFATVGWIVPAPFGRNPEQFENQIARWIHFAAIVGRIVQIVVAVPARFVLIAGWFAPVALGFAQLELVRSEPSLEYFAAPVHSVFAHSVRIAEHFAGFVDSDSAALVPSSDFLDWTDFAAGWHLPKYY